jgi:hypothetical protein
MVRRICMTMAILAGLGAAVLLASTVTTPYDGESVSCGTVIGAAAVTDGARPDAPGLTRSEAARARQVDRACHGALVRTTALAGLAAIVCVGFGTVVAFRREDTDDADTTRSPRPVLV